MAHMHVTKEKLTKEMLLHMQTLEVQGRNQTPPMSRRKSWIHDARCIGGAVSLDATPLDMHALIQVWLCCVGTLVLFAFALRLSSSLFGTLVVLPAALLAALLSRRLFSTGLFCTGLSVRCSTVLVSTYKVESTSDSSQVCGQT
jgi:hypothetical protein